MRKVILMLLFVCMLSGVLANEHYINIKQNGDTLFVNHFISLEKSEEIKVLLPDSYESLTSNINYSVLNSSMVVSGQKISINYVQQKEDSFGNLIYFSVSVDGKANFSRLLVDLFLEKDYILNRELSAPKRLEVISDGNSQIVSWKFENFNRTDLVIALEKQEDNTLNYLIIFGVLILGVGAIILFQPKKSKKEHLLEDETKIIELLKKADRRESWQRKIQEETGFSKAKLSRMIRNLEARELIEKIPMGNTNKIRLI